MQDWLTLDRRPTLVFGAGGLGGASALSLAAQGARVALVDVNAENLDTVVRAAKEGGREVKPLVADLRTAEACRAAGVAFEVVPGITSAIAAAAYPASWRIDIGRLTRYADSAFGWAARASLSGFMTASSERRH